MILLDSYSYLLESCLTSKYSSLQEEPNKLSYFEEFISDFDRSVYKVNLKDKNSSVVQISLKLNCVQQLKDNGLMEYLGSIYGSYLIDTPVSGYSVTLEVDLQNLTEDFNTMLRKVSYLKRNCFASAFIKFFDLLKEGKDSDLTRIDHREDESYYIKSSSDRVTLIYSTRFRDVDDLCISRVFMQEFVEARRRYDNAPQILYSAKNPPTELGSAAESSDNLVYITFVLQPRHMSEKNRDKTINLIFMLRNYIHYHIKCSKAYLQMRMRSKCNDFIKVLNRSKMEEKRNTVVKVVTNDLSEL